jgi:hypothetical protein
VEQLVPMKRLRAVAAWVCTTTPQGIVPTPQIVSFCWFYWAIDALMLWHALMCVNSRSCSCVCVPLSH